MPSSYREIPGPVAGSKRAPWHINRKQDHWYGASTDFAVKHLVGPGQCLVIGSPLFEALELEKTWEVTYLDVREPPHKFERFVHADATDMPLLDAHFDAVSSACVLTHAGLGRYGDVVVKGGDELMMDEIKRVLKPGCLAALTFGGVIAAEHPVIISNLHRIYTIEEAKRMCGGFTIEDVGVWSTTKKQWVETPTEDLENFDYLSVLIRNVAPTKQG